MSDILISTVNDLPGHEVVATPGAWPGPIVRSRNASSNVGAVSARRLAQ